jgi:hypothetical protein
MKIYRLAVLFFLVFSCQLSQAALIVSDTDPLLDGSTLIDFSEVLLGTEDPTINGIDFVGVDGPVTTAIDEAGPILGIFLPPPSLQNPSDSISTAGTPFDIFFNSPVAAMGFTMTAINTPTTLEVYDIYDNLLDSVVFPDDILGVHFRGFGDLGANIARARVQTDDWLYMDELRYVAVAAVPLPSTFVLLLLGLPLLGSRLRRG